MSTLPFQYRVRSSARARRVRLRVTPERGLEVIVPERFLELGDIPRLLLRKRRWIEGALKRAEARRALFDPQEVWRVPERIELPALGKVWTVQVQEADRRVTLRASGADRLQLSGRINDEAACRTVLSRWLVRQVHEHLVPRLEHLGRETGLRHRHVSVRRQKTRWASCSRHKDISLNVKLLFLSPALADYVLLHELCHTVEFNHSPRFWAQVARHCADFRERDVLLREMWYRVPRWAR